MKDNWINVYLKSKWGWPEWNGWWTIESQEWKRRQKKSLGNSEPESCSQNWIKAWVNAGWKWVWTSSHSRLQWDTQISVCPAVRWGVRNNDSHSLPSASVSMPLFLMKDPGTLLEYNRFLLRISHGGITDDYVSLQWSPSTTWLHFSLYKIWQDRTSTVDITCPVSLYLSLFDGSKERK